MKQSTADIMYFHRLSKYWLSLSHIIYNDLSFLYIVINQVRNRLGTKGRRTNHL